MSDAHQARQEQQLEITVAGWTCAHATRPMISTECCKRGFYAPLPGYYGKRGQIAQLKQEDKSLGAEMPIWMNLLIWCRKLVVRSFAAIDSYARPILG